MKPEQVVHLFDTGDSSFRDEIVEMPAKRAKDGKETIFTISSETKTKENIYN